MSEFKTGYVDAYRADIISMLDLAEELPLVHSPDVTISGHLHTNNLSVDVAGQSLTERDPESEEGIQARTDAAIGMIDLYHLSARVGMQLFASEINAAIPAGATAYTVEQEALADRILHKV